MDSISKVRKHSIATTIGSARLAATEDDDEEDSEEPTENVVKQEVDAEGNATGSRETACPIILSKPLEPSNKARRRTNSRGGVRRPRYVPLKIEPKTAVKEELVDLEPSLQFGLPEDKDLGWQEVMLHGLLLAGVPERLLSTEMKPLNPENHESVFEAGEIFSKAMA